MLTFFIILSILLSVGLIISFILNKRLIQKTEFYENTINDFYSSVSIVLHTMRTIDEKKMFETDDEVGELFSQLVDILSMLRPLLYGMEDNEKKEN